MLADVLKNLEQLAVVDLEVRRHQGNHADRLGQPAIPIAAVVEERLVGGGAIDRPAALHLDLAGPGSSP
jgi:hypothetical protein